MAVVGGAVEVAVKEFLEQVDVGALGVEHGLPVVVVLDDFLATVGADAQFDGRNLIAVVALHIVRRDVGHLAADGVLYGVYIAQLAATVDLVEMLRHVGVDDFLGIDDLAVDVLVGGSLHAQSRQLLLEIRDALLLFRHEDLDVVGGVRGEDEVDILQADIDAAGEDLLHVAFQDEMALGVGLALVEEDAGLVDEVFVGEEPHQGVGFVAPTGNRHILCACREEEQGEK